MGVWVSKDQSVLLEDCEDASQSSPPSVASNSKLHSALPPLLDPRSPTVGIDRTPILMPSRQTVVVDPRSPTMGIDRTPIICYGSQSGDVPAPAVDVLASEPLDQFNLVDVPKFPEKDLDLSDVFQDADKPVPSTDVPLAKKCSSEAEAVPVKKLVSSRCNSVPYAHSPASNKLFGGSGPRSPLAPRNCDAPRNASTPLGIVQRKQAIHVEKLRNADSPLVPGMEVTRRITHYQLYDKENL